MKHSLATLFHRYIRWRHSKGYGVHSPYAYRFVTEVLKPGNYGYYAYHQLESFNRNLKTRRVSFFREAKFLIRLAIFLKTKRIITYKEKYPEAQSVAKALKIIYYCCESNSSISFKEGDLMVLPSGVMIDSALIQNAIDKNVPLFAINPSPEIRELLEIPIKHGVLFSGSSKILLIPRPQMEYVAYSINL